MVPDTDDVKQKKLLFTANTLGVMRYCFTFLFFCKVLSGTRTKRQKFACFDLNFESILNATSIESSALSFKTENKGIVAWFNISASDQWFPPPVNGSVTHNCSPKIAVIDNFCRHTRCTAPYFAEVDCNFIWKEKPCYHTSYQRRVYSWLVCFTISNLSSCKLS